MIHEAEPGVASHRQTNLHFRADNPSQAYDVFIDLSGAISHASVAAGDDLRIIPIGDLGDQAHLFIRTQAADGTIGVYDVYWDGPSCSASGLVDVATP